MGYLISETTKEEREKIVAESLGNIDAACDGCMSGLVEMYPSCTFEKKPDLKKRECGRLWQQMLKIKVN